MVAWACIGEEGVAWESKGLWCVIVVVMRIHILNCSIHLSNILSVLGQSTMATRLFPIHCPLRPQHSAIIYDLIGMIRIEEDFESSVTNWRRKMDLSSQAWFTYHGGRWVHKSTPNANVYDAEEYRDQKRVGHWSINFKSWRIGSGINVLHFNISIRTYPQRMPVNQSMTQYL